MAKDGRQHGAGALVIARHGLRAWCLSGLAALCDKPGGRAAGDGMSFGRMVKRKAKAAIPPLVFLSLVGYFGWNATQGDRGLKAYALQLQDLKLAQSQLAAAEAERDAWEMKVSGLRSNHLDPDTLDERARAMLNLADPGDIVVPYGQGKRLFDPN
jgi:cell division protein FtsB